MVKENRFYTTCGCGGLLSTVFVRSKEILRLGVQNIVLFRFKRSFGRFTCFSSVFPPTAPFYMKTSWFNFPIIAATCWHKTIDAYGKSFTRHCIVLRWNVARRTSYVFETLESYSRTIPVKICEDYLVVVIPRVVPGYQRSIFSFSSCPA